MTKIWLDLDGVLCDFEKGVADLFDGQHPRDIQPKVMWKKLASVDGFYANLSWMNDGKDLWNSVKKFNPTILTGIPLGNWAPKQKRVWCGRNLGWDVPVITCFAREKFLHGQPGDILIDDTAKNGVAWKDMGGTFILHTSTQSSLSQLKEFLK